MNSPDNFLVGISNETRKVKPTNVAREKELATAGYGYYKLEDIADAVGNHGKSFMPEYLEGGLKQENFQSMQLFLLDFDGRKYSDKRQVWQGTDISFYQVKKRAEDYGLRIAFAYKTFSAPEKGESYKFRIAFAHKYSINDRTIAKFIYKLLATIFPECDAACTEVSRLFLGGKECFYFDGSARFDFVQIINFIYPLLDKGGHLQRSLRQLKKEIGIEVINNHLAVGSIDNISIFGVKADSPEVTILTVGDAFTPIFYIPHQHSTCVNDLHQIETSDKPKRYSLDISEQTGCCQLMDDFIKGEEVDHNQKFALWTNFINIKGGIKAFNEILSKHYSFDTVDRWLQAEKYMKNYHPQNCSASFCPYYDECMKYAEYPNAVVRLLNDRKVYVQEETEYGSLVKATECLANNMEAAFMSTQDGIHLIRAQTAMGKTTQIINLIKRHPGKRYLIAEYTNILKNEVYERLQLAGITDVDITDSVRDCIFIEQADRDSYEQLHQTGNHAEARKIVIDELNRTLESNPEQRAKIETLESIRDGINGKIDSKVLVTTHAMLINTNPELLRLYDAIIIDEDILYLQLFSSTRNVSRQCVESLANSSLQPYAEIARKMLRAQPGVYYRTDWYYDFTPYTRIVDTEDEYDESEGIVVTGEDDYADLIRAGAYVLIDNVYQYLYISKLPSGLKYLVLSATMDVTLYKKFFENSMKVIEYKQIQVRYIGRLIQFTYHSLGRSDLEDKRELYDIIEDELGIKKDHIITFKSEAEYVNTEYNLHFGNAIGVNGFAGENIAIVGTYFKNPIGYKLPCCYLYGPESVVEKQWKNQRVCYKGMNFRLMAFSTPELQQIQLNSIESEMEQCVGRARLLRKDCMVYVFSAYPCEQAEIHTEDYLQKYRKNIGEGQC